MNYDSFGRVIASQGDRIRISNKATGASLEGESLHEIHSAKDGFVIRVDGTSMENCFQLAEWSVEVIVPPLEDGYYQSTANKNIYAVRDGVITNSRLNLGSQATRSAYSASGFVQVVAEGSMVKVAEL